MGRMALNLLFFLFCFSQKCNLTGALLKCSSCATPQARINALLRHIKSYPKLEMQNKFAVRPLRETPIRICHCICKLQYLQSKYVVFFFLTVIH